MASLILWKIAYYLGYVYFGNTIQCVVDTWWLWISSAFGIFSLRLLKCLLHIQLFYIALLGVVRVCDMLSRVVNKYYISFGLEHQNTKNFDGRYEKGPRMDGIVCICKPTNLCFHLLAISSLLDWIIDDVVEVLRNLCDAL